MTKTGWAELPTKAQWDIQVAMRGPDCQHSEGIKYLTTGVIRWAMHTVMRVGGTLNEDLGMIIVPNDCHTWDREIRGKQEDRVNSWSPAHFFQHVMEAGQWLGINVRMVPNQVYQRAVRQQQPAYGLYLIWEWATEGSDDPARFSGDLKLSKEIERHLQHAHGIGPDNYKILKKGVID